MNKKINNKRKKHNNVICVSVYITVVKDRLIYLVFLYVMLAFT